MRHSQEMDTMISMMHTQINRAIRSAITDRVIPEIQSVIGNLPLNQNGAGKDMSSSDQGLCSKLKGSKEILTKKTLGPPLILEKPWT